jgi:hypothetical protein
MNHEPGSMWKEVFVVFCKVLSTNLPGSVEKDEKKVSEDSLCPSRDSKRALSRHKSQVFTLEPVCSV